MYGYRSLVLAALIVMSLSACQTDSGATEDTGAATGATDDTTAPDKKIIDLTVNLAPPKAGYQVVTEPSIVPAGAEVEICSVVRVESKGDDKLFWVNEMESLVSESSHHMNVLFGQFSFFDAFLGENAFETALGIGIGNYNCADLDSLMEKALPIFPSQRSNQRITFPEGVGVPMMAPLVLIFSHHYINPTANDIRINAALNVETVDADAVTDVGFLIFDSDLDLDIPGGSQTTEAQTCIMDRDVNIALVSTHSHEKGDCATLNAFSAADNAITKTPFYVNKYWEVPPLLHFKRDELKLSAGDGIHYACHYRNSEDRDLTFGPTSADEMCVFAAMAYPAPLTKEEVTAAFTKGELQDIVALAESMMTDCAKKTEFQSPWPMSGNPHFGDYNDNCKEYDQTESNTLW